MPPRSLAELAAELACDKTVLGSVSWSGHVPGAPASWADGDPIPPRLKGALAAAGIERLYTHQAEALAALQAGRHVVTVTPTASGKSLVYMLPTLEKLAADPSARALYLFPYKALEQDQLA